LVTAASDPQRLHDYIYALVQHFTVKGVTSVLTFETTGGGADAGFDSSNVGGRFSNMSDNIVLLSMKLNDNAKRGVSVLKARGSAHDLGTHEVEITGKGLRVL